MGAWWTTPVSVTAEALQRFNVSSANNLQQVVAPRHAHNSQLEHFGIRDKKRILISHNQSNMRPSKRPINLDSKEKIRLLNTAISNLAVGRTLKLSCVILILDPTLRQEPHCIPVHTQHRQTMNF